MKRLVEELIPHAPQMGLFVAPQIPKDRLNAALGDYARTVGAEDVLALYDATLLGNGKDGAVLTTDRLVFQNNRLEPVHDVHYRDLVRVEEKRKLLGGRKVHLGVNRGRATFDLAIDFSGRPEAAPYLARFLHEAMLAGTAAEMDGTAGAPESTDHAAVRQALDALHRAGRLAAADHRRLLAALDAGR